MTGGNDSSDISFRQYGSGETDAEPATDVGTVGATKEPDYKSAPDVKTNPDQNDALGTATDTVESVVSGLTDAGRRTAITFSIFRQRLRALTVYTVGMSGLGLVLVGAFLLFRLVIPEFQSVSVPAHIADSPLATQPRYQVGLMALGMLVTYFASR